MIKTICKIVLALFFVSNFCNGAAADNTYDYSEEIYTYNEYGEEYLNEDFVNENPDYAERNYYPYQLEDITKMAKCNNKLKVLVKSESANFEMKNTIYCYYIQSYDRIKLIDSHGEISYTSFKELKCDIEETHFYNNEIPEEINTDGSLNSNVEEIEEMYLRGKL